jgi:myo-inositol 2-dehydrogenase/D-chiro-inositol 1-dehydrogenase
MSVRVGLIGAGVMGADHARLLCTAVSGVQLVAVSDPDPKRMALVQRWSPNARAVAEPLAVVRDANVDAVLVASPDTTHCSLVLACLELGKPVLCEKPLAATVQECLRIVEKECALKRRLVTVGYMRRFDPGYVEMERRLKQGGLGAALLMHCIHRNKTTPSFITAPMLMTSSCVHEIDIARFMLDREIRRISVATPKRSTLSRIEDPQLVLMEMEDGVIVDAEIFLNAQYGYDVRAELVCERGTITLTPPRDVVVAHEQLEGYSFPEDWRPRFVTAYSMELQAWVHAIATGATVGASAWDGYVATAVAFAGLDALARKASVEIRLPPRPALYSE